MANIIYLATSLDGYIARKDGSIDWLMEVPNPDGSDFGFAEFMKNIDAIVMGRNTFQQVLTFGEWPYTKPVFVLSSSLAEVPPNFENKIELIKGEPSKIIKKLNSRNFNNLYIDGGNTVHRFIQENLIDELIVTRIPILLGSGIPLFPNLEKDQKFEHIKTEILNNNLVKSHYKKVNT